LLEEVRYDSDGNPITSNLGVRHIDMPCTAERVWNAVRAAPS
jgi:hypothetical protein